MKVRLVILGAVSAALLAFAGTAGATDVYRVHVAGGQDVHAVHPGSSSWTGLHPGSSSWTGVRALGEKWGSGART